MEQIDIETLNRQLKEAQELMRTQAAQIQRMKKVIGDARETLRKAGATVVSSSHKRFCKCCGLVRIADEVRAQLWKEA